MKLILLVFILQLFGLKMAAQNINDSVFNDVILIKQEDVARDGDDILIDIPIRPQKNPIVIYNSDIRINSKLFFERKSFLSEQNEFFLITPDWEFQKEVLEREKREGIHIKAARDKIYHIQRSWDVYQVDSLTISLVSRPTVTLNFKKIERQKNEICYYHIDCYGSECCPRDPRLMLHEEYQKKVRLFLEELNLNPLENVYKEFNGKEGEFCNYYSLIDLALEQKLPAIKALANILDINQSEDFPKIFLPKTIIKTP